MLRQRTIPRTIDPALDVDRLYAMGVEHVQRLSGRIWTDYNVHDPGVTILELLCFAITDLNYRAAFPVADLLASGEPGSPDTLFTARRALPNRPLTLLDLRKLVIDVPGIRNCWILPAAQEPAIYADTTRGVLGYEPSSRPEVRLVPISGLFRVLLDFTEGTTAIERQTAAREAEARLHANRNLCQDFVGFDEVETDPFNLCCELELESAADPAQVQARILFEVERVLAPPVWNYSLDEMLARKNEDGTPLGVEEIFDGPALDCGFIDDRELVAAELPSVLYLSDVMSVIQDIPGVRAIRDIVLMSSDATAPPPNRWRVPVRAGRKAVLNHGHSRMVFYKRNTPQLASVVGVQEAYARLVEDERVHLETSVPYDLPLPVGRSRDVAGYDSIQNHFPEIYGLNGTPSDPRRRELAAQLKGYLLFFDQLLADYLATLQNLRELYSIDPAQCKTRFHQLVSTLPGYEKVYADAAGFVQTMEAGDAAADPMRLRRNAFLDHLIARFGESFHDYVAAMRSTFGITPFSEIRRKCAFLSDLPRLASERGLAYDRSLRHDSALWNTHNVSGLERRLFHLLGLDDGRRRNLSSVAYDLYAQVDATPGDQHRFRVRDSDTGKILLSSSKYYPTPDDARAEMRVAIDLAKEDPHYRRHPTLEGDRWYFNIVDDRGEVVARRIEYFTSEAAMEAAIEHVKHYMLSHYSDEGLYVIENLLLRPGRRGDPLLPICVDPGCTDCFEADPYSNRLHIVLPAFGHRFQDMALRQMFEQTIRAEVPAHILPKICWISQEDMAELEGPYQAWLRMISGADHVEGEARVERITRLRDALYKVRNVYPTQRLADCDAPETTERFIVGQTAIGSGTNSKTERPPQ